MSALARMHHQVPSNKSGLSHNRSSVDDQPSPYPEGSANRIKQLTMYAGTDRAYQLANDHGASRATPDDEMSSRP